MNDISLANLQVALMQYAPPAVVPMAPPPPVVKPINWAGIPSRLRAIPQWLLWKWELKANKWDKVPKQPSGRNAQSNNPGTWFTFETVAQAYSTGQFAGIGFCLTASDGLQVIDLDHCFDASDRLEPWARQIVTSFNGTFIERSPRDGLHICVFAAPLGRHGRKREWHDPSTNAKKAVEIFDHGSPRYVCFTGDVFEQPYDIANGQNAVDWLCQTYELGHHSTKAGIQANPVTSSATLPTSADAQVQGLVSLSRESDKVQLREAAKFLKPNRDQWVRYGIALKQGGYEFQFFHELCTIWPDYAGEQDCRRMWDGLKPDGSLSIGSIFFDAKQSGWQRQTKFDLPIQLEDRWSSFTVPPQFELTGQGLSMWVSKNKKPELDPICDPIAVVAKTRGVDGEATAGLVLELMTLDKTIKEVTIPRGRLHDDGRALARELASHSFRIKPGKEQQLLLFLGECAPTKELIAVGRTGWTSAAPGQEKLVFVFPDKTTDPGYRYQPEKGGSSYSVVHERGTLADWVTSVYAPFKNNNYCLYEMLKSLSAPLQKFASIDTGGEHIFGRTTSGKTTLAQVGASVWGCGADPSKDPGKSYLRKWNATANAMEGVLAQHNDLPVYFDELGTYGGADFDKLVYNATGGIGKAAMDASRNLRQQRFWQTLITSTGEISSIDRIEESSYGKKKTAKGGQLIRLVDREVKDTTFKNAQEVDALKRACATSYGTLGPAFIESIIAVYTTSTLQQTLLNLLERTTARLMSNRTEFGALQRRALRRFALAEVAGLLLVNFGIVPGLTEHQVMAAVDAVVDDWAPSSKNLNDEERAIKSLREFITSNRDTRFRAYGLRGGFHQVLDDTHTEVPIERVYKELAGFIDSSEQVVYMLPQALQEATAMSAKVVATELDQRGLIVRERNGSGLQKRIRFEKQQTWTYAIKLSLLSENPDSPNVFDWNSLR